MKVTLEIPDAIAERLSSNRELMSQSIIEKMAAQAYRTGILSAREVSSLLRHESRWETEDFLSTHDAWPGQTILEVTEDGKDLVRVFSK